MADRPPFIGTGDDTVDDTSSTPRWVYVFGIVALVVVLLVVILMLSGGGGHGPSRH